MRKFVRESILAGAVALGLVAAPAFGQSVPTPAAATAFQLTPYAGYMMFGKFVEGPLGTSISSAGGRVYGAQLGIAVAPQLSVIGNVAYSAGDLQAGIPLLGGIDVGTSKALMLDGGLQYTLPTTRSAVMALTPFVQAGAGVIRYDIDMGGDMLQTRSTSAAYNLGVGADIPFGSNLGLRFMAKDYIGKFDVQDATGIDYQTKATHNWAITAGLKLEF